MRSLGVLFLFVAGLLLGLAPRAAQASLCSFHADMHAAAPAAGRTDGLRDVAKAITVAAAAIIDQSETVPLDSGDAHKVPDGQACCHPAPIATACAELGLGPCSPLSVSTSCSAFRCWAEPGTDIYRPPALS
jgi:hypothetical protein